MKNMNVEFKSYHPIVNFTYFLVVTGISMLIMNPFILCVSLLGAAVFTARIKKQTVVKFLGITVMSVVIMSTVFNPLFNHRGETVLCYFHGGNPLTLESAVYGFFSGVMLSAVICWFSCFNEIMTSDKLMYLTGRVLPSFSLIFSMTLRFVPKISQQLKKMIETQRCLEPEDTGFKGRVKRGVRIFSAMINYALLSSIKTSDSMRARKYGIQKRSSFLVYTIRGRDIAVLVFIVLCASLLLVFYFSGKLGYRYFPDISFNGILYSMPFAALCLFPSVIELWEVLKWKYLRSQI